MANQNSLISYIPQPYFIEGACTITGLFNVDSIENDDGVFDPDLSNYTTVNITATQEQFAIRMLFDKQSDHLTNYNMSIGLIGCSMLTYEDDGGGSPVLATEFSEDISSLANTINISAFSDDVGSYAHNSQDSINTFCQQPMPSIISGGRSNILFTNLGASDVSVAALVSFLFERTATNIAARPHAKLIIGHLFIGVDIPIIIDPRSFSWTMNSEREKFVARDFGAINSDGTLVKRSTGEIIKISNYNLIGSEVLTFSPDITITSSLVSNFFDLIKINTSYPLLFNPYPVPIAQAAGASLTVQGLNLTARQNFFSIYGFLEDPLDIQTGEYRDGLDSEYRARFRILETR